MSRKTIDMKKEHKKSSVAGIFNAFMTCVSRRPNRIGNFNIF